MSEPTNIPADFRDFMRGDDGAFVRIYNEHAARVFAVCRRLLRREEWADDVAQEVWLRVLNLRAKPVEVDNPSAYIFRIARNLCLDALKLHRSHESLESIDPGAPPVDLQQHQREPRVDEELVMDALHQLPDAYREILFLNIYCDYSLEEIASMTNASPTAVWQRASRARKRLREILARKIQREQIAVDRLLSQSEPEARHGRS